LNVEEVLRKALELEEIAFETYKKMSEETEDPEVRELLEVLAAQEREHIRIISDRLKMIKFMKK